MPAAAQTVALLVWRPCVAQQNLCKCGGEECAEGVTVAVCVVCVGRRGVYTAKKKIIKNWSVAGN